MDSSKLSVLLLLLMLSISFTPATLACGGCPKTPSTKPPKGGIRVPPIIGKPPITVPPVIGKPPITVPPVIVPPITLPPVTVPPITLPPGIVPPIIGGTPPMIGGTPPMIGGTPPTKKPAGCPPPPATCPIDTIKLGGCIDLLGTGIIHIGDPAANECCPVISGLASVEAALCFCTTIKLKVLDMNIYFPIALQILITCGKTPPPGYTCPV